MTFIRGLAAGVLLAGAAVGLASPASADPTAGEYTATIIDPGATQEKGPWRWSLLPCGQDCVHLAAGSGPGWDLHRQGNVWTGTDAANFTVILDNDSLVATMVEPGLPNVVVGMTKNG